MFLKKKVALLASVLVLNSWAGSSLAGIEQAHLTVRATLIPTSCKVEVNGGAPLDFGSDFSTSKTADLKIQCSNKALATISVNDDKKGGHTLENNQFVLVDSQDNKKGYFSIKLGNPDLPNDEIHAKFLVTSTDGKQNSQWERLSSPYLNPINSDGSNRYISLGTAASTFDSNNAQLAFDDLTVPLEIKVTADEGKVSEDENISGKATFTVMYT